MLTDTLDPQHQLERVLAANEALYAKWSRRPPIRQAGDTLVFADPEPFTDGEQAHVREVAAGVVAGLDADPRTLAMVLDALGVLPEKTSADNVVDMPTKGRQYGRCSHCLRSSIPLRKKDGLLVGHSRYHHKSVAEARCTGGGTQPIKQRRAAA